MLISSPTRVRPTFGRGITSSAESYGTDRAALGRPFLSVVLGVSLACFSMACGDDGPAAQTGIGGSLNAPDASVRDLPGDGLERTPDFDTDNRQRNPIGPEELVRTIDEIQNNLGGASGQSPDAPDASPDTRADAGAD
jgi:hypothetical protein